MASFACRLTASPTGQRGRREQWRESGAELVAAGDGPGEQQGAGDSRLLGGLVAARRRSMELVATASRIKSPGRYDFATPGRNWATARRSAAQAARTPPYLLVDG
ncbi:hypothetical protein GCM10009593_21880 [Microlunatus antarcticus]